MPISQWSHSRLTNFEKCAYRAKLAYIDKIPEPKRPLPPGKSEHPNERGTRIHSLAEQYALGKIDEVPHELRFFAPEYEKLKKLVKGGKASLEGEWAFDKEWMPVSWFSDKTWGRVKLDSFIGWTRKEGVVVDYKTGKRYGNEFAHTEQGQLYALTSFLRYSDLELVHVEFWYTDLNELHATKYTRKQALMHFKTWNDRALKMTTTNRFEPNPNLFSCQWCPFNPKLGGTCEYAVNP